MWSRQGAIQIHVYLYLTLQFTDIPTSFVSSHVFVWLHAHHNYLLTDHTLLCKCWWSWWWELVALAFFQSEHTVISVLMCWSSQHFESHFKSRTVWHCLQWTWTYSLVYATLCLWFTGNIWLYRNLFWLTDWLIKCYLAVITNGDNELIICNICWKFYLLPIVGMPWMVTQALSVVFCVISLTSDDVARQCCC